MISTISERECYSMSEVANNTQSHNQQPATVVATMAESVNGYLPGSHPEYVSISLVDGNKSSVKDRT